MQQPRCDLGLACNRLDRGRIVTLLGQYPIRCLKNVFACCGVRLHLSGSSWLIVQPKYNRRARGKSRGNPFPFTNSFSRKVFRFPLKKAHFPTLWLPLPTSLRNSWALQTVALQTYPLPPSSQRLFSTPAHMPYSFSRRPH